ncbi:hypothetical protein F0L74_22940 [Chitinophaga agrisoli]|uniref:Uncharacterized protein n=1 Tax=Chitinophaga agrisoli TaxID=2607653 RepID=A0A5B2VJ27_9BACT|nr:hypothetical protein [Chitinophaga agrisoli]KAA2239071.1 hypothetical protein F0L74_22940 [Chitinophaga agrisoli]
MVIMHNDIDIFSLGKSSLFSVTTKDKDGVTATTNFTNTYDADGKLSFQKMSNGENDFMLEYIYTKAVAKEQ